MLNSESALLWEMFKKISESHCLNIYRQIMTEGVWDQFEGRFWMRFSFPRCMHDHASF